jgi:hypothetical protein
MTEVEEWECIDAAWIHAIHGRSPLSSHEFARWFARHWAPNTTDTEWLYTKAARESDDRGVEDVFRERAEARAILWSAGEYDLCQAVDVLQADAERTGLLELIGQDAVQAIMAAPFGAARAPQQQPPPLDDHHEPVGDYDHVSDEDGDDDDHDHHHGGHVASSTIKAVEFLTKQGDRNRLRVWLAKHTRAERLAIKNHFRRKA